MTTTEDRKPYVISITDVAQITAVERWAKYIGMTRTKAVTAACMLAFKYENMRIENEMLKKRLEIAEGNMITPPSHDLIAELMRSAME